MGIISRFLSIFKAGANQVADQMEDPKASLDYSLVRLEESRSQVNRSLVEVSTAKNRLEHQRNQLYAEIQKYEEQARMSVRIDREDLARTALQRKQEAESRRMEIEASLDNIEQQVENLKQSQANLERKIVLFRSKKEELKAVYDSSKAQLRVRETISGVSADLNDIGNTIQRAEARIREIQARSDAIDGLIAEGVIRDPLEPQLDDIDRQLLTASRERAIEEELAQLRLEAGGEPPHLISSGSEPSDPSDTPQLPPESGSDSQ
jgi:phage shock protein A